MSVTVQVTTVVPTANWDGASLTTLAMPQLSETIGVPRSTPAAEHWPGSALTVRLPGQAIAGGVVSRTVNVAWHWALWPDGSVAVSVIVWGPELTKVPAAGLWLMVTARQLSDASTLLVKSGTAAWQLASASACWSAAHCVIVGFSVSLTVTCFSQVLPHAPLEVLRLKVDRKSVV